MMLLRVAESSLGVAAFYSSNDNRLLNIHGLYTIELSPRLLLALKDFIGFRSFNLI